MRLVRTTCIAALALAAAALGLCATTQPALAQGSYPNKPITLVVPYPAGGLSDVIARSLNTLLANNTDGWVLQDAVAINTRGQIVARGTSASGSGYALLTPATVPADPYATVPSAPASLAASQLT
eukprot:gene2820-3530_t